MNLDEGKGPREKKEEEDSRVGEAKGRRRIPQWPRAAPNTPLAAHLGASDVPYLGKAAFSGPLARESPEAWELPPLG